MRSFAIFGLRGRIYRFGRVMANDDVRNARWTKFGEVWHGF